MQIGKVLRKHRKSKNLTQEEMANRLGVTAPAVNKWENGNSYPDIMLLSLPSPDCIIKISELCEGFPFRKPLAPVTVPTR